MQLRPLGRHEVARVTPSLRARCSSANSVSDRNFTLWSWGALAPFQPQSAEMIAPFS
jgi:hypothetical protein